MPRVALHHVCIVKLQVPSAAILRKGVFEMERDNFDEAIDEIVAFTGGDMRLALRAILIESVLIEEELRQMRAASPHANKQFPSIFQAARTRPRPHD